VEIGWKCSMGRKNSRTVQSRLLYVDLLAKMEGKDTVLIKGTPGVGKSLFLMVLLVSIVEKARQANVASTM